jgi:HAD superfamily phosphoserine phosphatase-like hydrolase
MAGAVFSDVEGTLIAGSLPGTFVKMARARGMIAPLRLVQAFALNILAKPMPEKINLYLRYLSLRLIVKGKTVGELAEVLDATIPALMPNLKGEVWERLRAHQAAGMPVVLVSAAMHPAVVRIAQELGVRGEGTPIEVACGKYTGKGSAPNMHEAKAECVRRVAAELGVNLAESIGYGDTLPDAPFLKLLGKAAVVDPTPEVEAAAQQHGWEIIRTSGTPAPAAV